MGEMCKKLKIKIKIKKKKKKKKKIGALTFPDGLDILSNLAGGFRTKEMKR